MHDRNVQIEADDARRVLVHEFLRDERHLGWEGLNDPPEPAVCDSQPRVLVRAPSRGLPRTTSEDLRELIEVVSCNRMAGVGRGEVLSVGIQGRRRTPSIVARDVLYRCGLWIFRLELAEAILRRFRTTVSAVTIVTAARFRALSCGRACRPAVGTQNKGHGDARVAHWVYLYRVVTSDAGSDRYMIRHRNRWVGVDAQLVLF